MFFRGAYLAQNVGRTELESPAIYSSRAREINPFESTLRESSPSMSKSSLCNFCRGSLSKLDQYEKFCLVSSDCRPLQHQSSIGICQDCGLLQRVQTKKWVEACQAIYESYCAYPQGSHTEQKVTVSGNATLKSRSRELIHNIETRCEIRDKSVWLDVGCGQAHLLGLASQHFPNLSFVGLDRAEVSRFFVEAIDRATFVLDLEDLDVCPGIVSMIHVLEHIEEPMHFLEEVRRIMDRNTRLVIQVPTFARNPMDLLIYDHGTFFTEETLNCVVRSAGFEVQCLEYVAGGKELLLVARKTDDYGAMQSIAKKKFDKLRQDAEIALEYLSRIREHAQEVSESRTVQVFGSAIGATWIYNELGAEKIECFLDEDLDRIGHNFLGKEIRSAKEIDPARTVFPLDPNLRIRIQSRLDQ